ncbi:recombinase RecT [Mesorhizobium sp. BR1-1-16]|uniref:recombinase RecT n=1 Tax=Mesorhizobium sp. BR1-1-16 TaxID=2876653 RepID=UPI001CC94A12|nr:recombinase RecT [Mesorhizobium sp. BR1-1-16]MBZ9939181.1 recombinase RecT [Mesorhizobium sp. BR1-1-16]
MAGPWRLPFRSRPGRTFRIRAPPCCGSPCLHSAGDCSVTQVATITEQPRPSRQFLEVSDAIPVLDTARFEHMHRIATVMAKSSLLPKTLTSIGKKDEEEPLPYEQVLANAFLVVNQAVRWGLDPFSVAQCVSVVHGKLCYEGKLVAAVIEAKAGIRLHHHLDGNGEARRIYLSDVAFTAEIIAILSPGIRLPGMRLFDGSVSEWKTTGLGSPWKATNFDRMLIYRGTRDWTRIYEPALMLGVYTEDEMMDLADNARAARAKPIGGMAERLAASKGDGGFSTARVETEIAAAVISSNSKEEPHQHHASAPAAEAETPDQSHNAPESREDRETVATEATPTTGETAATSSNLSEPVEGEDGRAERGTVAPRLSLSADDRAFLGRFATALRPGTDSKELFDLRQKFGKAAGMWPSPGTDLRKGIEKIYAIETSRAVGEFGPEDADARVEDLLS